MRKCSKGVKLETPQGAAYHFLQSLFLSDNYVIIRQRAALPVGKINAWIEEGQ
jgi:hypothetical protein